MAADIAIHRITGVRITERILLSTSKGASFSTRTLIVEQEDGETRIPLFSDGDGLDSVEVQP